MALCCDSCSDACAGVCEKPGTPGRDRRPGNTAPPAACSPDDKPACATSAELKLELKADAKPGRTGAGDAAEAAPASDVTAAVDGACSPGNAGSADATPGALEAGKPA